ncbi:LPS assembly lipoprotein LptE [Breoghania sp. L-A4]|uniref:LPS assembly lipoprotein LptE n=1 Tax=Breoghania sp. L-A4 TaxID=2304600 RepID=UPI000E35ED3E|nr:LPS assembly lipoprotein LptE [Breoghania sp. L-A4]AXS38803.1 hypothetical protein D1F64_00440 [Breoghania sp. L-A4]
MSLHNTPSGRRRNLGLALFGVLLAAGVALGGCNVRPLYGTTLGAGGQTYEKLAAIQIDPAKDRVEQVLRNELIFMFQRGGEAAPTRYRLRTILNQSRSAVAVEELADVPAAYLVAMTASFLLIDADTDETLLTGTSFANASYDFSNQRFANLRAARDAEDRAAKVIADDIRTRIASYFATKG